MVEFEFRDRLYGWLFYWLVVANPWAGERMQQLEYVAYRMIFRQRLKWIKEDCNREE